MDFTKTLRNCSVMLTEAAITERLRRRDDIELHPTLFNTPLIYDAHGRSCLQEIYGQYREIARKHKMPVLLCAPTWRVDRNRIFEARLNKSLNRDAVLFMRGLQRSWQDSTSPVFIGGLIGPRHDCYQPDEALSTEDAKEYHSWQVAELAAAGVDVIIGQTFPAVSEALGVVKSCQETGIACIMSFVINRKACVLDGTPIAEAVKVTDEETASFPDGYMVNCVYPTFIQAHIQPRSLFTSLVGIQANASSLDHADLDGSGVLKQDDLGEWGELMVALNRDYSMKILGGCCGTDNRYLEYIAERLA